MTKCDNKECFYNSLAKCKKTDFLSDNPDLTTQYNIIGKNDGGCEVYVKLIQVKRGSAELSGLSDKDMSCILPFGVITEPEKNLKNCHGSLKEEIQNIIIQRLHSQISENLGKISTETTKVI
jgi:hypothetical protein